MKDTELRSVLLKSGLVGEVSGELCKKVHIRDIEEIFKYYRQQMDSKLAEQDEHIDDLNDKLDAIADYLEVRVVRITNPPKYKVIEEEE